MYNNLQFLINPFFLLKILMLIMIFVFIIFMLIVLVQVRSMARTINQPRTAIVVTVGIILLLAAASLFLTSLVIL
ncbi:MAG: hypothetical protein A2W22_05765 [Candidatus Levybacteria bacterium RBG_16_35_11]|nr:MAG: hypothetical protein A2W22_05765 [Candidatus Levybacteria bacterium RBG_16_35_11]